MVAQAEQIALLLAHCRAVTFAIAWLSCYVKSVCSKLQLQQLRCCQQNFVILVSYNYLLMDTLLRESPPHFTCLY